MATNRLASYFQATAPRDDQADDPVRVRVLHREGFTAIVGQTLLLVEPGSTIQIPRSTVESAPRGFFQVLSTPKGMNRS